MSKNYLGCRRRLKKPLEPEQLEEKKWGARAKAGAAWKKKQGAGSRAGKDLAVSPSLLLSYKSIKINNLECDITYRGTSKSLSGFLNRLGEF